MVIAEEHKELADAGYRDASLAWRASATGSLPDRCAWRWRATAEAVIHLATIQAPGTPARRELTLLRLLQDAAMLPDACARGRAAAVGWAALEGAC